MSWLLRHRVRHYIRNSIWVLPVLAMVFALAAVQLLHWFEESMGWELAIHADAARAVLGMLAASMFTFIVFVSSALLIAVQLASAQLSPRIIAMLFRDLVTKLSLTVFVFTFTITLAVLVRVADSVPKLTTYLAAYSSLASLGVFLYLIDHVGKALRPSGALRNVGRLGREVIESVYPRPLTEAPREPTPAGRPGEVGEPTAVIANPRDGVILAFDIKGLVSLAGRADCVIEIVPQVGDFVAAGDPLFRVFGRGASLTPRTLCQAVAVGQERTLEQDPTFALRIIVDIASKGLSPAINDPTTAVLAIDQIHYLLRNVGNRQLTDERVRDASGRLRLMYRTPNWEDFVHLAVTEIRHFGGESIQVARRLRAMLENLIQTLPEERATQLRQELNLLHRSAERFFLEPEDRALAEVSDFQGVGGTPGKSQAQRAVRPGPGCANVVEDGTEHQGYSSQEKES
jgi:uncharacterized membrane protein